MTPDLLLLVITYSQMTGLQINQKRFAQVDDLLQLCYHYLELDQYNELKEWVTVSQPGNIFIAKNIIVVNQINHINYLAEVTKRTIAVSKMREAQSQLQYALDKVIYAIDKMEGLR